MKVISAIICCIILSAACTDNKVTALDETGVFNADSFAKIVKDFSSDEYEGRKPFTRSETKSINYIRDKFQSFGIEPGNHDSYFQDVPMVNIVAMSDKVLHVKAPKTNFDLKAPDDFIVWTDRGEPAQSLKDDEVIFAGYGVVAPEYNWDDYAGLNVKGKVVMVLVNDPGFNAGDSTLFKGKAMTYYGRWTYKFEEAARQGAKGCLIVHENTAAGYPFIVPSGNFNTSRLHLDSRKTNEPYCNVIGWITNGSAKRMIAAAGMDSTSLIASADKKGFRGTPLPLKLSTTINVKADYNFSKNVIGKITGSKYPDETVIYTAHWDHLGIGVPDETGDSIYNGAYDNASGIAGLLELARSFSSLTVKPERTIVFLAVTAEEQGLWGSAYYAEHPVFPIEKTVADINMDGINYRGKTKDIIIVGKGQSELEDLVISEGKKQGRYLAEEDQPEAGYYYRSDHFNFAKKGVPALHFEDGFVMDKFTPEEVKKEKEEYLTKHYHRPSDEFSDKWNFDGAVEDLRLYFEMGKKLAAGHFWPGWKDGSEFKARREQTAATRK